jgi:acyl-coenzyme A thioesterase PaaI-like protein
MHPDTHLSIDTTLCGRLTHLKADYAEVLLHTTQYMAADDLGLVHGGFLFGAADYAAMCAVNDPHVVLGAAEVKFLAPTCVGDAVRFEATTKTQQGKKQRVLVRGLVADRLVFEGCFTTFVLKRHILAPAPKH